LRAVARRAIVLPYNAGGKHDMLRDLKQTATWYGDIAYSDEGSGPPALFVHGVFLNGYLWRHVIDRVSDMRRCIAVDLLAHGATRTPRNQDVSFAAQAEMLEAVCENLKLDQVDLVGNDSGGGIAQIFAARHPERIRSLTLTNCDVHDNWPPKAFETTRNAVAQGHLAEMGKRLLADIDHARRSFATCYEHPARLSEQTLRTYLEPLFATPDTIRNLERWFVWSGDCSQTVVIEPLLRELQAPTLVVWGTGDRYFPLKWAYWLRDTIPGCRKVIELDGAKLFFPEERPDELAAALREHWLSEPAALFRPMARTEAVI
jgi:pimeloyl-ACP methyl ester carboxylesterase